MIFANSVAGVRSNFEGGSVALAAGITGRVPPYGYYLPQHRHGTALTDVRDRLQRRVEWGALGCVIGREVYDYRQVPVLVGLDVEPGGGRAQASGGCPGELRLFCNVPSRRGDARGTHR